MKNRLSLLLVLSLLGIGVLPSTAVETARHRTEQAIPAHRWDVIDISFHLGEAPKQPTSVKFFATFESETGKRIRLPGFYNGADEYILRFTPGSKGLWSYRTESSLTALDGMTGKVSVGAARAGRKGGVMIDEKSPRQFRHQSGDPYYPIAFECDWLFALDAGNAEDMPVTRKFVDSLAANGFNQVVMNVFAYDVTWKKDNRYFDYVVKENVSIGVRLPKEARGRTMTGTWFNPFDGSFSKPTSRKISQWPAFSKPAGEGFRILIVETQPEGK